MVELTFIQYFIAEFAFAFIFVPFFLGMTPPLHKKSTIRGLFGLMFLFPFYTRMISFNFVINIIIFFIFIIYGILSFIPMIKYKGRMYAIEEHEKKSLKPKYGLNDTLKRINKIINYILFPFVISLVTVFLGAKDITVLFGLESKILKLYELKRAAHE